MSINNHTHISNLNPFRYRGYTYDQETGLYYLTTRYYDPYVGRFLNADGLVSTGIGLDGYNMFAYCNSNPVNMIDPNGNAPGDLFDTMDEAAMDFANIYAKLGYENRLEYASFIYTVNVYETRTYSVPNKKYFINFSLKKGFFWDCKTDGYKTVSRRFKVKKYSYVTPNEGTEDEACVPTNWFNLKNKVAEIHNHIWIDGHRNNYPSDKDVRAHICYITTPSGILKKFDPDVYDESNYDETVVS